MDNRKKALGGVGPGAGLGACALAVVRTTKLSEDAAKLRAAEHKLIDLGWKWKDGKWV